MIFFLSNTTDIQHFKLCQYHISGSLWVHAITCQRHVKVCKSDFAFSSTLILSKLIFDYDKCEFYSATYSRDLENWYNDEF